MCTKESTRNLILNDEIPQKGIDAHYHHSYSTL